VNKGVLVFRHTSRCFGLGVGPSVSPSLSATTSTFPKNIPTMNQMFLRLLWCAVITLISSANSFSQAAPSPVRRSNRPTPVTCGVPILRDTHAISIIADGVRRMSSAPGSAIVASGTVEETLGSTHLQGTIKFAGRGIDQSAVHITYGTETRDIVFSRSRALEKENGTVKSPRSLEWAASGQVPILPLQLMSSALTDDNVEIRPTGPGDDALTRVTLRNCALLPEFSTKDVLIDTATGFVKEVSFDRSRGGGASPTRRFTYKYSNYRRFGSFILPANIEVIANGVLWRTIVIADVETNAVLTNEDFKLQ